MRTTSRYILAITAAYAAGCQDYTHVFQPDTEREGTHLRFEVQQPSKADILFVVDNSRSMLEEQEALQASFDSMLEALAPRDTSYRIGIVSTDAYGYDFDCCGQPIPFLAQGDRANAGACHRCTCGGSTDDQVCTAFEPTCSVCDPAVELRRGQLHHDGARGRLIAAYDPEIFDVNATDAEGDPRYDIDPALAPILASAFPTDAFTGPGIVGWVGQGVPHVIDRQTIRHNACIVCACDVCMETDDDTDACFNECAKPIAASLVTAYFSSNINGLGIHGWGYEQGIRAALMAVGIDPENRDDPFDPGSRLTRPGEANSFVTIDSTGAPVTQSWLRDDALLAVMFVADEEDCSMPNNLMKTVAFREDQELLPPGGFCYRSDDSELLKVDVMADLLEQKKGTASRVAIGFIGGVQNAGTSRRSGAPTDCANSNVPPDEQPSTACSCLTGVDPADHDGWCQITTKKDGIGATCDALAGSRYYEFAEEFGRHTYDSICRTGEEAFGGALRDFAELATLACFELEGVHPYRSDGSLITVKRASREDAAEGVAPTLLPRVDPNVSPPPPGGGWFYEPDDNMVCLVGIDRLLGDVYDIFVLYENRLDFSR